MSKGDVPGLHVRALIEANEALRRMDAMQKSINPPLMAPRELRNQPSSILPGEVTYIDPGADLGEVILKSNPARVKTALSSGAWRSLYRGVPYAKSNAPASVPNPHDIFAQMAKAVAEEAKPDYSDLIEEAILGYKP